MNLVKLTTFEDNELVTPVVAAWVSKQLVQYQKKMEELSHLLSSFMLLGLMVSFLCFLRMSPT